MRDYEKEASDKKNNKYAYNFDYDVMHPYIIKTLVPFFQAGNVLELGCYQGNFTELLLPYFNDITCVDASESALNMAQKRVGKKVKFVHSLFEEAKLPVTYENIILCHVLEHVDNPVGILNKICTQWLSNKGYLFVICPNANAASRQIAVKMGLISHNSAVTENEYEHGHKNTYSFDTLERDIVSAGLDVVYRTGVMFKALANFQWDKIMQTDIITKEYFNGCYKLGQQYPELCSSILFVCRK